MQRAGQFVTFGGRPAQTGLTLLQIIQARSLTSGLKLCLDAADVASYDGSSQSWLDRSGGGYDFFRGADGSATSTDPTFNGVAGRGSKEEYFSGDGGDYFTYDSAVETWMSNLHKDGALYSWVAGVYIAGASANTSIFGSTNGSDRDGIRIRHTAGNVLNVSAQHATGNAMALVTTATGTTNSWNFFGGSIDEANASGGILKINGTTETGKNPTYTTPSTNAASVPKLLNDASSGIAQSGTRIAFLAIWEGVALSSTNLDNLYADIAAARAYGF